MVDAKASFLLPLGENIVVVFVLLLLLLLLFIFFLLIASATVAVLMMVAVGEARLWDVSAVGESINGVDLRKGPFPASQVNRHTLLLGLLGTLHIGAARLAVPIGGATIGLLYLGYEC